LPLDRKIFYSMQYNNKPTKLLVVRNDKLGDLLVSFSTFALLKKNLPNTEIHVLVSKYTAPIAEMCEFIDHVIIDPISLDHNNKSRSFSLTLKLIKLLQQQQYDVVITLFSSFHVGFSVFVAKIPVRITPATKLAQVFYNHRITQHRSRSEKPEHRYNQELAEHLLSQLNISPFKSVKAPFLTFDSKLNKDLKQEFIDKHNIPVDHQLVFIHPGSGGSARNLSTEQFSQLANTLQELSDMTIIISYGPNEALPALQVYEKIIGSKVLYESKDGLEKFCQHLQLADCFISGSTGPLHIAGVLDRPTAGFYTRRRSATSLRWQTLNSEKNRLAFSPPESSEAEDMSGIDITQAAKKIAQRFL